MRPSRLLFISAAVLALLPTVIYAHERFMRHDLKFPLHEAYFGRHPEAFLGVQPDMMHIGTISFLFLDRKSTRLNSSHGYISYAVFCLKKKKTTQQRCVSMFTY